MPAKFRDWKEFMRRPRVPRAQKKLVQNKEDEIHERIGAWTKVPHPEISGSTYWVNPETGETSYDTPESIKYFLPQALQEEAAKEDPGCQGGESYGVAFQPLAKSGQGGEEGE